MASGAETNHTDPIGRDSAVSSVRSNIRQCESSVGKR